MGFLSDLLVGVLDSMDDGGCDWYCDYCGAHLNSQSGFTVSYGTWDCSACGEENNVSDDNILPDDYIGVWNERELDDGTIERQRFTKTREVYDYIKPNGDKCSIWRRR